MCNIVDKIYPELTLPYLTFWALAQQTHMVHGLKWNVKESWNLREIMNFIGSKEGYFAHVFFKTCWELPPLLTYSDSMVNRDQF